MSKYIDGFVVPVPKDKLDVYKEMAAKASRIWKEYGALEYRECLLEDPKAEGCFPFPQLSNVKEGDLVVFSYIAYKSKEQRNEIMAKIMADPRMGEMCGEGGMPFDCTRMAYGGFETIVES